MQNPDRWDTAAKYCGRDNQPRWGAKVIDGPTLRDWGAFVGCAGRTPCQ